jgi:hypothetical protein
MTLSRMRQRSYSHRRRDAAHGCTPRRQHGMSHVGRLNSLAEKLDMQRYSTGDALRVLNSIFRGNVTSSCLGKMPFGPLHISRLGHFLLKCTHIQFGRLGYKRDFRSGRSEFGIRNA